MKRFTSRRGESRHGLRPWPPINLIKLDSRKSTKGAVVYGELRDACWTVREQLDWLNR